MLKRQIEKEGFETQTKREAHLHAMAAHSNIVAFLGCFEDDSKLYFVMERLAGGSLKGVMVKRRHKPLREDVVACLAFQVASAVKHLHSLGIIHRDIKPDNLLIDGVSARGDGKRSPTRFGLVKLSDFGWACRSKTNRRTTICGTEQYLPPEMRSGRPYGPSVDAWCLGTTIYELAVGKSP
eukprot:Polyplicarium_translucidae@DN3284_c0_g1_i3.p1